jgi:hypothetical protein
MNINLLIFTILLIPISHASAQNKISKSDSKVTISEVYVLSGFTMNDIKHGSLSDFKKVAPESVLLQNDFTGYSEQGWYEWGGKSVFSALLGIQFMEKQKGTPRKNPILRLGVNYTSGAILSGGMFRKDRRRYDTLASARTGQQIYLDSVTRTNYGMRYNSDQIQFDGSLIFRSHPEARWSLFGGIGITTGFSIRSNTVINYFRSGGTETRFPNDDYIYTSNYDYDGNNYKSETFNNKNKMVISTYLPMGLDFRIGKKNQFWKQIHLFYEFRPGITMTSIDRLQTLVSVAIPQALGIKIGW